MNNVRGDLTGTLDMMKFVLGRSQYGKKVIFSLQLAGEILDLILLLESWQANSKMLY